LIGILPLALQSLHYKEYRLSLLGTTCIIGYASFTFNRVGGMKFTVLGYASFTFNRVGGMKFTVLINVRLSCVTFTT
jgi:hypothetical protein